MHHGVLVTCYTWISIMETTKVYIFANWQRCVSSLATIQPSKYQEMSFDLTRSSAYALMPGNGIQEIMLMDYRDMKLLLFFYPTDFDETTESEFRHLQQLTKKLAKYDCQVLSTVLRTVSGCRTYWTQWTFITCKNKFEQDTQHMIFSLGHVIN